MLTGENGILSQAQNASTETDKASLIEQVKLDILAKQTEGNGITGGDLQEILKKYFTEESIPTDANEISGETNLKALDSYGGYEIKLSDIYNGEIKTTPVAAITATNFPASDYGAIVTNYTCQNSAGVSNWKIFYADGTNIYLIADDYIHKDYCPNGANGSAIYDNGNGYKLSMNNVYKDYTGSASITDEKIKALNNDYFNVKEYTSTNENIRAVAYMLDTDAWSGFKGEDADYAIGGPTIEMFFNSYNEKYGKSYVAEATSATGYLVGNGSASSYSLTLDTTDDPLYVISSTDKAIAMWLASPSAIYASIVMSVTYNGYVNNFNYSTAHYGFRPLVSLKSDVQLKKTGDKTYEIIK